MRIINSIRFLLTFIFVGIFTGITCLLYGTEEALEVLQKQGIILTNDKNERNRKKQ